MADIKQKNLKLDDHSIELLRFLAYLEGSTESEVVEQALVKAIALKVATKLQVANLGPFDGEDDDTVIEARYMVQRLDKWDSRFHWRITLNADSQWQLERREDAVENWGSWPWQGATIHQQTASAFLALYNDDDDVPEF